ncbi:Error-prone DNA polymerase, partial [Friedmanniomyces endolithicus]
MAAWKRKGGLEKYYERIVGGMLERGYKQEFAEAIFSQIQGFGEYGFPESHAASFALLAYASSWLKCHEPAAFLCALLNSQPMGFYAPAQIVRDAREHGVTVHPIDVSASAWDNTLEGARVLRLGLRQIDGFRQDWAKAIARVRGAAPLVSIET